MNPTNEQELREQVFAISEQVYIPNDTKDYTGVKIGVNFLELERLIQAYTNAKIAKVLERLEVSMPEVRSDTSEFKSLTKYEQRKLLTRYDFAVDVKKAIAAERAKLEEVK